MKATTAMLAGPYRVELRAWCDAAWHHSEVADACGLSLSTLSKVLAGRAVEAATRGKIERALERRRAQRRAS